MGYKVVTTTQEKRYKAIEKIFDLIKDEFEGLDITAAFTKKLLEDAISIINTKALCVPLSAINNKLIDKK